jgi:hypothetical protein
VINTITSGKKDAVKSPDAVSCRSRANDDFSIAVVGEIPRAPLANLSITRDER